MHLKQDVGAVHINKKVCKECKKTCDAEYSYCPYCGEPLDAELSNKLGLKTKLSPLFSSTIFALAISSPGEKWYYIMLAAFIFWIPFCFAHVGVEVIVDRQDNTWGRLRGAVCTVEVMLGAAALSIFFNYLTGGTFFPVFSAFWG